MCFYSLVSVSRLVTFITFDYVTGYRESWREGKGEGDKYMDR